MMSRTQRKSCLCLETLEGRCVPSGCQAFGGAISNAAQNVGPLFGASVSAVAQFQPKALANTFAFIKGIVCP